MDISSVLVIIGIFVAIIGALVSILYKILSQRIDKIDVVYGNVRVDISSIKTDMAWIKKKINGSNL